MADGSLITATPADALVRPLHVVHVVTRFLRAGSEENTVATARWQAAKGHQVTLVHGAEHDPGWVAEVAVGLKICPLPEMIHPIRPMADWRAIRALERIFRDLGPDVIHTHQSKAGILGRIAARAVPSALVVHGIHILPWEGARPMARMSYIAAERFAARRTDLFIAVSHGVADATLAAGIGSAERMHVVHSGMNLAPFRVATRPADAARLIGADPSDPARPPVILMLAAFEPRKRHAAFLAVLPRIIAQVPRLRVLLAGSGPEEDAVRAQASTLGLSDHIVFCGHRPDPAALLALADLTVLTSGREGLPRVVVQSIAAGCPVVVTRLPGIAEIVQDGVNGCITDPLDLSLTADRIAGLLTNPADLLRLRAGARATDVSAWSLDRLGARTTTHYQAALARRDTE